MFDVLRGINQAFIFTHKKLIHMDLRKLFWKIVPEGTYSVREAARFLGVHRCTIYAYIIHPERPLPFFRTADNVRMRFSGEDLLSFKKAGFPKRGRKRKARDGKTPPR